MCTTPSPVMATETSGPTHRKACENRRSNKPIMEKRRRARINNCLNELKNLILDALKKDPARHSKLEKADILEMTVKHLETLQRQQVAMAMAADPGVVNKYRAGFSECASEVGRFLGRVDGLDVKVKQHLLSHLANCISGVGSGANGSSTGQLVASGHVVATPVQVHLPTATISVIPQGPGGNGEVPSNVFRGLQLVPTRLPSGDIAFVFPSAPDALAVQQPVASPTEVKLKTESTHVQYPDLKVSCDSTSEVPGLTRSFSSTSIKSEQPTPSTLPSTIVTGSQPSSVLCHSTKLESSSSITYLSADFKPVSQAATSPRLATYSPVLKEEPANTLTCSLPSVTVHSNIPTVLTTSSYTVTQPRRAEMVTSLPPLKPISPVNEVTSSNNGPSVTSTSLYIPDKEKLSTLAARTAVVAPVSVIPPIPSPVYLEPADEKPCGLDLRINQTPKQVIYGGTSSKSSLMDLKPTATVLPSMVPVTSSSLYEFNTLAKPDLADDSDHMWRPW